MRAIPGSSLALIAVILSLHSTEHAVADDFYVVRQNQTGISLPGVNPPSGFDEVRAADGTTCRSAVGGAGAYLDSGVIGGGLNDGGSNTITAYGRLVMPLGKGPRRINCNHLYRLELERLQLEVQMLKRGLDPRLNDTQVGEEDTWAEEGWGRDGGTQEQNSEEQLNGENTKAIESANSKGN